MKNLSVGEMRILAINALYASVERSYACKTVHVAPIEEPTPMKGVCIKHTMYSLAKDAHVGNNAYGMRKPKKSDTMELLLQAMASANKKASNALLRLKRLREKLAIALQPVEVTATTGNTWLQALKAEKAKRSYVTQTKQTIVRVEILAIAYNEDCERLEKEINKLAVTQTYTSGMKKLKARKTKGRKVNNAIKTWQARNIEIQKALEMRALEASYKKKQVKIAS